MAKKLQILMWFPLDAYKEWMSKLRVEKNRVRKTTNDSRSLKRRRIWHEILRGVKEDVVEVITDTCTKESNICIYPIHPHRKTHVLH